MSLLLPAAFAALALAALLLPSAIDRLRGALGLPVFALGAVSLPRLADIRGPEPTLWISAALLLLGPAMLLLAAWRARSWLAPRLPVILLVAASVGAALVAAWPTLRLGGVLPAVLTAGAIALSGRFLWILCSMLGLGRAVRWLDGRLPLSRGESPWGALLLVAGALAVGTAALRWPLWVELWQSVGVAVGVLGAWWGAATGRAPLALAGAAFATAFTAPELAPGAWVLLAVAALSIRRWPRAGAALSAAGGYLAAPALLDAEVVYTVLLAGAATALLAALASPPRVEGVGAR